MRLHDMLSRYSRIFGTASSCFLLLLAARVDARPCSSVSADRAASESVLILKGSLISTATVGTPGSDSTSVIHVDRVLKGNSTRRNVTVTHFVCGIEYSLAMRKGRPLIVFVDG